MVQLDVNVKPAVETVYTPHCQLDFCLPPAKFELTYIDKDEEKRLLLFCIEQFWDLLTVSWHIFLRETKICQHGLHQFR